MMGSVSGQQPPDDLVEYLMTSCPLSRAEATRVVADVLGYFSEAAQDYVRRRHRELRARGLNNDVAFQQIATEIPHRRYTSPDLSLRQLRRIVYG
jgi:phosphoribosylpyrophosphate synthetase